MNNKTIRFPILNFTFIIYICKVYLKKLITLFSNQSLDITTYVLLNNKYKINVLLDSGSGKDSFWLSENLMNTLGIKKEMLQVMEKKSEFNPDLTTKFYNGDIGSISTSFATLKNLKSLL
ncbi:hypothetical protein FW781_13320 [Chryseobacterium panacisoli]|uniref:Aspartyl protease n=1 Tax=Chryseobacterium panacisoli TaxID=1807141 RepID=A0A5D8ZKE8_9FLAO|nr:hypothetical protein [Chryseobacterium panacisoli]TZF94876.1 hypothetical protein FW781_13320 [Chryseobacterium panacisoli]